MIVEVVRQAEQTLVGLTVRRRPPVHHGDWVSRCWRRRYLSWSWRGSPTAASATFSCSAPLQHLLTGLQGLLLPHPRGQLIHQPPCGVRVMVSWRSRPDWAADRDGWYPLQSVVSDDQTKKRKKKTVTLPRICPVNTEQRAASICCLKQPSTLGESSSPPLEKVLKLSFHICGGAVASGFQRAASRVQQQMAVHSD